MTDASNKDITITEAIEIQSRDGGWICPNCWNYGGGVRCKANVFIAFVGAYMKDCWAFDDSVKKPSEVSDEQVQLQDAL